MAWTGTASAGSTPLKLPNVALRNNGDLTFSDASTTWRFGLEADISHGMATADLDGDGDQDVVINRLDSPALVMRNDATAPRVLVRLKAEGPNTRAVGAMIHVLGGPVPDQMREVTAGGLTSHSDYGQSFATGSGIGHPGVDWPGGRRTTLPGEPGRIRLLQPTSSTAILARLPRSPRSSRRSDLIGHRRVEDLFDDWSRQRLLPSSLAHLGPGVTWFDLDRDGDEDLFIGSGRGGKLACSGTTTGDHRRTERARGRARRRDHNPACRSPARCRCWAGAPEQMRGRRARASVGGTIRSERRTAAREAQPRDPIRRTGPPHRDGTATATSISSSGAGAAGRVSAFALVPFLPEYGERRARARCGQHRRHGIGMISSATFADIDGDGDEGRPGSPGNGAASCCCSAPAGPSRGRPRRGDWMPGRAANGVAVGDLDGDGPDLVATSWGRNTVAQRIPPALLLYFGNFDANNTVDLMMARDDPRWARRPRW